MDEIQKRYLSVGNWFDKETKQPKSRLCQINEGINQKGKAYQIADNDLSMIVDGTYSVGDIFAFSMTSISDAKPQQDASSLKLKSST